MATNTETTRVVHFGAFELDLRSSELRKKGVRIRLQEQPFQILVMLLGQPGEVVAREEIRKRLWPSDTFVDFDHGLNAAINRLRTALGDSAQNPKFIETLPRRGYRFIGPAAGPARKGLLPAHREVKKIRLAVLPMNDYSDGYRRDYFSEGLTEELITQLGSLNPGELGVIARTSVARYRNTVRTIGEIGRELSADYLLEGSVRRVGERVRISAQLIQVSDETHVWAESFERDLRDVLLLQDEVARTVARKIHVTLTTQEEGPATRRQQVNPEAYEAYLLGRHHWGRLCGEGWKRARACFESAIALDPEYARAYAGLGDCYSKFGQFALLPPREAFPQAREAALKAISLDPTLAEAHGSLGLIRCLFDWDWSGAEQELRRALELGPQTAIIHSWYSWFLLAMGRKEEALHEAQSGIALEPFGNITNAIMGWLSYATTDYPAAEASFRKTIEVHPDSFLAHFLLGMTHLATSRVEQATALLERALELSGNDYGSGYLALARVMAGRREQVIQMQDQLMEKARRTYVAANIFAGVSMALGNLDEMYQWLNRAFEERDSSLVLLNCLPDYAPLRSDPRFQPLVERMKFPPLEKPTRHSAGSDGRTPIM